MTWNQPGGSKDKDPWGNQNNNQGPPDLDEVVKKMQDKFRGIFGGKGGGGGSSPGGAGIGLIVVALVVFWGIIGYYKTGSIYGAYIVEEGKRGVEMRFGKYIRTTQPGLNFHLPWPFDKKLIVDTSNVRNAEIGYRANQGTSRSVRREALMLTQDENIIDIEFSIQYKVKSAEDYVFNLKDPDKTLRQATESAVREVIGKNDMDFVLTEGRSEIVAKIDILIQEILDRYESGLILTSVNMQNAQPPEQVQAAFSDAVKAREDKERKKNEAEAYRNKVQPRADGDAKRLVEEALGYEEKVKENALGETSRFLNVLAVYEKAPEVTRERYYIEAIEEVMKRTSKVMLDVEGSSNLLYLPFDRLVKGAGRSPQFGMNNSGFTPEDLMNKQSAQPASRARINDLGERTRSLRSRESR